MMLATAPTRTQLDYVGILLKRILPEASPAVIDMLGSCTDGRTRKEISGLIEALKRQLQAPIVAERAAAATSEPKVMRDLFAETPEFSPGLYRGIDGKVFFVYKAKAGTHWLTKEVIGFGTADVNFRYGGAAKNVTTTASRLSGAEHAAFGQLSSNCGFCALHLEDPTSRAHGYGPVCASKNGLPY